MPPLLLTLTALAFSDNSSKSSGWVLLLFNKAAIDGCILNLYTANCDPSCIFKFMNGEATTCVASTRRWSMARALRTSPGLGSRRGLCRCWLQAPRRVWRWMAQASTAAFRWASTTPADRASVDRPTAVLATRALRCRAALGRLQAARLPGKRRVAAGRVALRTAGGLQFAPVEC